jgi:hypothetical protein|tara:strand:- start:168 stop:434 length:267 start_codon:yes stop_codon:yes gene_type:complete
MKSFKLLYRRLSKYLSKPKDYSKGSKDMITMMRANEARTEESATKNSQWAPGALKRHDKEVKRMAKLQRKLSKSDTPEVDKMLAKKES